MATPGTSVGGLNELAAEAAVRLVVDEPGLLSLVAQPIVDLTDGRPAGFELLARVPADWQVPPDRLFAAARRLGQAARLQTSVNERAIDLLAQVPSGCFLCVNLAPADLVDPTVVAPLLDLDALAPLVVEVTEQDWPDGAGVALDALGALRSRGALLALDDVGTGFAGLARIRRLRPEIVKLDMDLVAGLGQDPAAELVVASLGRLCGQLDAWVVAEGIERADQLAVLVRLGVPLGQGFLLGRGEQPWSQGHGSEHVVPAADARAAGPQTVGGLLLDLAPGGWRRDPDGFYRTQVGDRVHRATTMDPATRVEDALLRAVARPADERWVPVLVTDETGHALGQVTVESMVTAALRPEAPPEP